MIKLYKPGGRVSVWKIKGEIPAAVEGCQILGFGFITWPDFNAWGHTYYAFRSPELQGPFELTRRRAFVSWFRSCRDESLFITLLALNLVGLAILANKIFSL